MILNYKYIKFLIKIVLFIIYFLFFNINIISKFNNFISYLSFQKDIKEIEKFLKICKSLIKLKKFKINDSPKISIISPIYNRERFILRFLKSIQYQNFKNIEIILVDDCSLDNSVKIIEEVKNQDERIILIKNKRNKGTFIARNIGVLSAKGKYLILPDPDDIISKNILSFCYCFAEKYDYEIIRFTTYRGNGIIGNIKYVTILGNKSVYQPKLSTNIFYGNNELEMIDFAINNKFIKTIVYKKALNSLNNFYLNLFIITLEDTIINYIIMRTAKSFYFSTKIGYFYLLNPISITEHIFKISKLRIRFGFIFLKIINDYSKNTKYEKDMVNLFLTKFIRQFEYKNIKSILSFSDFNFFYFIINIYLNYTFITNENKYLFESLKIIVERKFKK